MSGFVERSGGYVTSVCESTRVMCANKSDQAAFVDSLLEVGEVLGVAGQTWFPEDCISGIVAADLVDSCASVEAIYLIHCRFL